MLPLKNSPAEKLEGLCLVKSNPAIGIGVTNSAFEFSVNEYSEKIKPIKISFLKFIVVTFTF